MIYSKVQSNCNFVVLPIVSIIIPAWISTTGK